MKTTDALECLSALAHETRLAAFRHLVQIGPAGLPVGSLQEKLGVPPATLTAHLNILRGAGLVEDEREEALTKPIRNWCPRHAAVGSRSRSQPGCPRHPG
jgi:ArsR family transcriptional regulator